MNRKISCVALLAVSIVSSLSRLASAGEADCFRIQVVDAETGRGVPLVELRTVNDLRYFTDSQGIVAFDEPGLLGHEVFFHVKSHGYEFPKDGFGFSGKALKTSAGGSVKLPIRRINLAERLYRITGAGIYAESAKAGLAAPTREPVLNGQVLGSDTVLHAPYRGKLFWVWGDTNRPQYPLGNYQTPAGTSQLPDQGGLDPEVGVDLTYFVDDKGFARGMCAMPGSGPTWVESLVALEEGGRERLYAGYVKVKPPLTIYAHGLAVYQDDAEKFETLATFDEQAPLHPSGHVFRHTDAGVDYLYFAKPFPLVRVRATEADLKDPARYQGYTCLEEGTKLAAARIARADGRTQYAWRTNTPVVRQEDQVKLVREGKLKADEALLPIVDEASGKSVTAHGGSVAWNPWRARWICIFVEHGGSSSLLGEVWYAEADTPVGPWVYAVKIATHNKYTFYNPKHHPLFNKAEGRVIFFEGTYTHTFSGNTDQTPRYDYNQMMYKLDLANPRLVLPVPVYAAKGAEASGTWATLARREKTGEFSIPFFALDRPRPGAVPVLRDKTDAQALRVGPAAKARDAGDPDALFYALPVDSSESSRTTAPLFEFSDEAGKARRYAVEGAKFPGFKRSEKPLCRVWINPRAPRGE
jgi:hypothetical protein